MILKSQIDESTIPKEISHLTLDEIVDFVDQYYSNTPVKMILSKFKVNTKSIHNILPFLISDAKCRYCDAKMLKILPPKTTLLEPEYKQLYLCTNCEHQDTPTQSLDCGCDSCLLDRFGLGDNFTSKNFDKKSFHPIVSHLTSDEMIDLIRQYYLNEPYVNLIKQFNLKCHNPYKFLPTLIVDACCRLCKGKITTNVPTRSELLNPYKFSAPYYCVTCNLQEKSYENDYQIKNHISSFNEKFNKEEIADSNEKFNREEIAGSNEKFNIEGITSLNKNFDENEASDSKKSIDELKPVVDISRNFSKYKARPPAKFKESKLSLKEKIFLAAVLNATFNYEADVIDPFYTSNRPIATIGDYEYSILLHLIQKNIIIPLDEDYHNFKKCVYRKLVYETTYQLNIESDIKNEDLHSTVNRLKEPTFEPTEQDDIDTMFSLWKKISLSEILDELYRFLHETKFPNDITKNALNYLEGLLLVLPPSQIFAFIYRSFAEISFNLYREKTRFQDATKGVLANITHLEKIARLYDYSYRRSRDRLNYKSHLTEIVESKLLKINESEHFDSSIVIKEFKKSSKI